MRSQYPKLTALKNLLQKSKSDPTAADVESIEADDWYASAEYSTDLLLELARHIKFHGSTTLLNYQSMSKEIQYFNSTVENIFRGSLGDLDGDLGNVALLGDDEIDFIRRAHHLDLLSSSLFTFLANSTTCSKAHTARIHLSGFLDPEFNFDLLIAACEEKYWHFAKCRRSEFRYYPFRVSLTNMQKGPRATNGMEAYWPWFLLQSGTGERCLEKHTDRIRR